MESKTTLTEHLKNAGGYMALVGLLAGVAGYNNLSAQQALFERVMAQSGKGDVTLLASAGGEKRQFLIMPDQIDIPDGLKDIIARANDTNTPLDITVKTPKETFCQLTLRGEALAKLESLSTLRRMLITADLASHCAPLTTSAAPSAETFAAYLAPATPQPVIHAGERVDTLAPASPERSV